MIISANGIVLNEYSDVLLVRRDDTRTLAPPGGACEIDELPPDAVAREVREETGITAYPVRLVGLYYLPASADDFLFLSFRCFHRDGEARPSDETPQAGFFSTNPLPGSMLAFHREQIADAFGHSGGPPLWKEIRVSTPMRVGLFLLNRLIYPWFRVRRSRQGLPAYNPPPNWEVRAALILRNKDGEILLLRKDKTDSFSLPFSDAADSQPPWTLAEKLATDTLSGGGALDGLSGIYLSQGKPRMDFIFTGTVSEDGEPLPSQALFCAPDSLPDSLPAEQKSLITDARQPDHQLTYALLKS